LAEAPGRLALSHPDIAMPASLSETCVRAEDRDGAQHVLLNDDELHLHQDVSAWRAAALRLQLRSGEMRCVALAIPEMYAPAMTRSLTQAIVASLILGVLGSGIAVWLIAKRLLAPVSTVESWAQRAAARTPRRRRRRYADALAGAPPIAELARVRKELEESRARLREAFAAQERFLSNAAHELKTPIAVLLAEAQTVKTAGIPEETLHFVRSVSDEMTRLGRMLESFLLLTKLRTGKAESHPERHPVNELAANAVEQSRTLALRHGVRLVARLDEAGLDAEVSGDDVLLQTMLDNLIRNAIRFSPRNGEVMIEVGAEDEFVEIAVRDEGPGIPPDVAARLFERFSSKDGEAKRGRSASLGLAVAQGIAELHGGSIRFSNRSSGGCEFVVRLALASAPNPV
jgi:signal transduction histidine kinase